MQRQRNRQQAELRAAMVAQPCSHATKESQHIKLIALENDIKRLRSMERIVDRIEMKRTELLPKWLPHAQEYLEGNRVYQNPILVYCIIWLLDTQQFEQALNWTDIAIEQGQETPPNIKSKLPTFVASTVLEWAEREAEAGRSVHPYFDRVFDKVRNIWKINERLGARYYKFAGMSLLREGGSDQPSGIYSTVLLEEADALLEKAEQLHPKVQVKTMRQRIAMRLRALQDN
ncbi:phage terminase small subunit [Plesiomonas shigelloides]|uniref:phage terminase small subunit n=1 Tax=Plesiomonas shigelloides TaxID=703 RepID=UPI001E6444C6|nr:phage terminase small subunit [Plesiomonas shigelloides]